MSGRRSLAVGVVLVAVVIAFLDRGPHSAVGDGPAAKEPAPPVQVGRFQIAGVPGNVFVLDTATGQVWEQVDSGSPDFLKPKIKGGTHARGPSGPEDVAALKRELKELRARVRGPEQRLPGRAKPEVASRPEPTYQGKPLSYWVQMLRDADLKFRTEGVEAVGMIGPRARGAIPALIEVLLDTAASDSIFEANREERVILAIAQVDPRHEFLRARLRHKDYPARRDAALALCAVNIYENRGRGEAAPEEAGKFRRPEDRKAIPVLIATLKDRQGVASSDEITFMELALACLRNFHGEAAPAVPALCELLADREGGVREKVAVVLGAIGPEARAAIPLLLKALHDKEPNVRAAAAEGLGGIGPEARAAVSQLRAGLKDADPKVRASSAAALGAVGARETIPALKDALKDKDPAVRASALKGLGGMKGAAREVVPMLLEALKDPEYGVQVEAMSALAKFGPDAKAAVPELIKRAKGFVDAGAKEALDALRQIAPEEAAKIPEVRPGVPTGFSPASYGPVPPVPSAPVPYGPGATGMSGSR